MADAAVMKRFWRDQEHGEQARGLGAQAPNDRRAPVALLPHGLEIDPSQRNRAPSPTRRRTRSPPAPARTRRRRGPFEGPWRRPFETKADLTGSGRAPSWRSAQPAASERPRSSTPARALEARPAGLVPRRARRSGRVPLEPPPRRAVDGGLPEPPAPGALAHREDLGARGRRRGRRRRERGKRAERRVPRADFLTDVASEDVRADRRLPRRRGSDRGARWSSRRCTVRRRAVPGSTKASVGHASRQRVQVPQLSATGASGRQVQVRQDLGQQQVASMLVVDEAAVLADPAEARGRGERPLRERRRVDADPSAPRVAEPGPGGRDHGERPRPEAAVVVGSPGVAGEARAVRGDPGRGRRRARRGRRRSARPAAASAGPSGRPGFPRGSASRRAVRRRASRRSARVAAAPPPARCRIGRSRARFASSRSTRAAKSRSGGAQIVLRQAARC